MANQGTPKPVASNKGRLRGKPSVPPPTPKGVKLLVTIVSRNKAEFYADFLQSFEVNMQLIMNAQGTASKETLHYLGLVETDKAVIFSVIREDRATEALSSLEQKFKTIKNGKGIAFTTPMTGTIGVAIYRFLSNTPVNT